MVDFDRLVVQPAFSTFGQTATYTPASGPPVTVTAVLSRPDTEIDVGVSGLHVPSWRAEVRVVELPAGAAKGDTLDVDGQSFRVRQITRDAPQVVAKLDLDPV